MPVNAWYSGFLGVGQRRSLVSQREHNTERQEICTQAPTSLLPSWGTLRKFLPFVGLICKMKAMESSMAPGFMASGSEGKWLRFE